MERSFAEQYVSGDVEAPEIDDFIDAWHNGLGDGKSLHEFLGLSWPEYAKWLEGRVLPTRKQART